jgi:hypothetical protein
MPDEQDMPAPETTTTRLDLMTAEEREYKSFLFPMLDASESNETEIVILKENGSEE